MWCVIRVGLRRHERTAVSHDEGIYVYKCRDDTIEGESFSSIRWCAAFCLPTAAVARYKNHWWCWVCHSCDNSMYSDSGIRRLTYGKRAHSTVFGKQQAQLAEMLNSVYLICPLWPLINDHLQRGRSFALSIKTYFGLHFVYFFLEKVKWTTTFPHLCGFYQSIVNEIDW